nr:MBL fold metallo-hydrolase [Actinomadura citrea]
MHAVNVYVIEDAEGLVVVDSGWAMPDTKASLEGALATLGHRLDDVAQFLVTHAHWDHYSQALALRDSFGTRVRIGRGERPSIEAFDVRRGLHPRQVELLRRCGADEVADEIAGRPVERSEQDVPHTMPDAWLDDGERVALTERGLDVFATPGHTRGHIVLRDAAAGLLFAGDHILPHISPSIGLETEPEPKPLRSYLESLRLVRDMPDTVLLPAHGPVRPSVHIRIDELLEHHAERLDAAAAQVRAGRGTAFEVAGAMPWTRRRRSLDDLDAFSRMLAVLEIEAHLDVLADRGVLDAHEEGGVRRYAARR